MFFDYIEGVPVKCFYVPVFSKTVNKDDLINYMYGKSRKFKIGDKLPLQTIWYKYPKNLIILSFKDGIHMAHIVKNGVLCDNKCLLGVDENIFDDIDMVINSDGDFINIRSYEDMCLYMNDMNSHVENLNNLESHNEFLVAKLNRAYSSIRIISSATSVKSLISLVHYEDVDDINVFFKREFKTKNMSLMEIKSFMLFNKDVFTRVNLIMLKSILRKKYELMYIDLDIEYEEYFNFYRRQVEMSKSNLSNRWKIDIGLKAEKRFGELLECLIWAFEKREDSFLVEKIMDGYISLCIKEFDDLLKNNPGLFSSYKKWNDFYISEEIDIDNVLDLVNLYNDEKVV